MERDEQFYYEAFGIEPPQETTEESGKTQEVAPPAEDTPVESAPAEEPAAEETGANEPENAPREEGDAEPAGESGAGGQPMSREERARQAALRRQAEQQAAVEAALREQRAQMDEELKELFGWAGFKDGTAPIESIEQFRDFREKTEMAQLQKDLKAGTMSPDQLRQVIAQEIRKQQPAPAPEAEDAGFAAAVQAELAEIARYDPDIKTPEDLLKLDRFAQFASEVKDHRHSYLEAYRITYADKIAEAQAGQAARAAAQRTQNSINSKAHLRPVGAKGEGGELPRVPDEVYRTYKAMMPGMTSEEIARDYAKYLRSNNRK